MRTEIFNPNNFQVSFRTHKDKNHIVINLLDLRLPAGTEVEAEETSSYGMIPMYYADDCCMVSAVYLAQIVCETLNRYHDEYYYECHVYTAYTILPNSDAESYQSKHRIQVHSGCTPNDWHRCHKEQLARLYRCADHAITGLMRDLQNPTVGPDVHAREYFVPYTLLEDLEQAEYKQAESLDAVWARLRQMSDPDDVKGMAELNKMVGMSAYKNYIHQLICDAQLRKMRALMGLRAETENPMHFVFTGNPGTGKTTAAKALGKALREAGILSRGEVVYRDRSTLVGAHVGESENLVKDLFERDAPGNVVVIDEAYALTSDSWKGDFGHRVVDSLMTYTADPKADFVVVLCGYPEEMNQLLASNAGLSSRFSLRFDFEDYSHDELMEITRRCLTEMDYHFTPEAETVYSELLSAVLNDHQPHFGNARWVKSAIHQHILLAHHRRLTQYLTRGGAQIRRELFTSIEGADILAVADQLRHLNMALSTPNAARRRIGFAA